MGAPLIRVVLRVSLSSCGTVDEPLILWNCGWASHPCVSLSSVSSPYKWDYGCALNPVELWVSLSSCGTVGDPLILWNCGWASHPPTFYTLSSRTGSALVFHSEGRTSQSEMYVWRSAGYIRKSLFIFGYLWNAIRIVLFWVGYSRASLTMYDNI